jgi:hypothetical protein
MTLNTKKTSQAADPVSDEPSWTQFHAAVQNPDVPPSDLLRQIIAAMADVCNQLKDATEHPSKSVRIKPLMAHLQSLRTLSAAVSAMHDLQIRQETIDLDGPKFRYVMGEFFEIFKCSAQESGCNEILVDTIMRILADNLGAAEARIRSNVKTIGEKGGFNWPSASGQTGSVESPSAEPDHGASPPN